MRTLREVVGVNIILEELAGGLVVQVTRENAATPSDPWGEEVSVFSVIEVNTEQVEIIACDAGDGEELTVYSSTRATRN